MSLAATLRNAFFGPHRGLPLAALRDAGFAEAELDAVQGTPAMADQLRRFAEGGGRIERVDAAFSGANGMPGLIRFYVPPVPQAHPHASYGSLAHELGHALFCPEQWQPPESFASAHAYARSRELGEAHAWLNQWRLTRSKLGGLPEPAPVLPIENDHDFGTQPVDIFTRIDERLAAGWSEAQVLDELALLNANMFPCGMGEGNFKTYGQCNRWDWLQATAGRHPAFTAFLQRLGRAPHADDQKLLTKFNVFTGPPDGLGLAQAAPDSGALDALADLLAATERRGDLDALYALGAGALPRCQPGVAACGRDAHALVRDGGVSSRT